MRTRIGSLAALTVCILVLTVGGVGAQGSPAHSDAPSEPLPRAGGPLVGWFPISTVSNTPGHAHELAPSVAYNSQAQEYLVVWQQATAGGENYVYGQFVSEGGTLIGSRFLVPGFSGVNAAPDVAYNPVRNEYLVVFLFDGASYDGVYGQRLNASGTATGPPITLAPSTTHAYRYPAVAYDPVTTQYLVVWQHTQGTAFSGIEACSLSGDGSTLSPIVEITGLVADLWPEKPAVDCAGTADGCLVVWHRWYDYNHTDHEIHGQRIGLVGSTHLEGPNFPIHFAVDDEIEPAVGAITRPDGSGQYLVVCARHQAGAWLIVGQMVSDDGVLGLFLPISTSNGLGPAVAGNQYSQEYLVAFMSQTGTRVRGITVSTSGNMPPRAHTFPVSHGPTSLDIASGPLGDYLVTCHDYYPGYPIDIFGALWGNRVFLPVVQRRSP